MNREYTCIKVRDIESSIRWYEEVLGFQCTHNSAQPNLVYALMEKDETKINLFNSDEGDYGSENIIFIEVLDIDREYQLIKTGNVSIFEPICPGVFSKKQFTITDNEGNKLVYLQSDGEWSLSDFD